MGINNGRTTIGVFIPYLSGFYMSGVAEELRVQCQKRDLDLVLIMTSGFGSYNLPLALDYIDAAYIVLNSVSSVFVQKLIESDIPVVSTVEDFFPLPVERVVSDQSDGIHQAFEHLTSLGHKKIGFAGVLAVPDFRARYNALLDCYRQKGWDFDENWLIRVNESSLSGGIDAATEFLKRDNRPTAIICGSDLLCLGFEETANASGISVPDDLALVGVDNTQMASNHRVGITSVDQGLDEMVSHALDRLQARLFGDAYREETEILEQQLVVRQSCGSKHALDFPARPNYLHSAHVMQDHNEIAIAFGAMNHNWLLDVSRLWGPFLKWSCMGVWKKPEIGNSQKEEAELSHISITNLLSEEHTQSVLAPLAGSSFDARSFPPKDIAQLPVPSPTFITLIPVSHDDVQWGVLSVVDELRDDMDQARYGMFNYYLLLMAIFMQRNALADSMMEREKSARKLADSLEILSNSSNDGIWIWNMETNVTEWNVRLLEMLGFNSEEDQQAYRHMSLLERAHPQDQNHVRELIRSHITDFSVFKAKFRIKSKDGNYIWVEASGEAIREPNGHIARFVGALTDITERQQRTKQIEFMAQHDPLTGLPNRGLLLEKLNDHIRDFSDQPLAVLSLNINRFKRVNDSYGHQVGDVLLNYIGRKITSVLRKSDVLSRFSGDEFVLICKVESNDQVNSVCRRILNTINGSFKHGDIEFDVSACLGATVFPDYGQLPDQLLKQADLAMQRAKSQLAQHAVMYQSGMEVDSKNQMAMESQLRKAISNDELFVQLQPLISTTDESLVGAEVLCRWQSKKFGLVPPGIFIGLAEEIGFISSIGDWVLTTVLEKLKDWHSRGHHQVKLSLNVSASQLHQQNFANNLCQLVQYYQIPPSCLNIEVTESAAITDIEHACEQLNQIQQAGIRISLDDFGTGYSSLRLLNDLPLDWVKIDRSFVKDLTSEDLHSGMIKSVTQMCHSMGYKVVAEGVEEEHQKDWIRHIGCDVIQGYFYDKPLNIQDFEAKYLS